MLKTNEEKLGYSLGIQLGRQISSIASLIDHAALFKGIQDGISGSSPLLNQEEINNYIASLKKSASSEKSELNRKKMEENFLKDNALKSGIISLPSGVQYKILKMGEGPSPKKSDKVKVHYRGFLIDGTEFSNTYTENEPGIIEVAKMMKGWMEVIQMMKPGDVWQVYIPSHLAYGKKGSGDLIGPNTTVAFQIELIEII